MTVRALTDRDVEQMWRLSQLAFGFTDEQPAQIRPGMIGVDGPDGRLLGMARIRSYEQWWGGRRVPMGGIAAVAVHPEGRGRGVAQQVVGATVARMRAAGQPVSALFPTAIGLYRRLGWEVVGDLHDTRLATRDLRVAGGTDVSVRTAGEADVAAVAAVYDALARTGNGALARDGVEFPHGAEQIWARSVVSVAQGPGGRLLGYAAYDRGQGYDADAQLRVLELAALDGEAYAALLRSLGSWDSVAPHVLWRGPTDELALQLPRPVPAPTHLQSWMLRINDAPAAIAARGYVGQGAAAFVLVDPLVPEHEGPWRLTVAGGEGRLERTAEEDLPVLDVRGLAVLYAGASDSATLVRTGLLSRVVPDLDAAFAGPAARIRDYF